MQKKDVLEPLQRVLMAIDHKEPDRVPCDLGGTESTSISLKAYAVFRRHLGLSEKEPEILSFGGQLAQPDKDLCQMMGVDTRRITRRNLSTWELDVKENENAWWYEDEWGVTWKMPKVEGHYFDMVANPLRGADFNPVALISQRDRDNQSTEIFGNTKVSFEILPGLVASAMTALQKNQTLNGYYDYKESAPSIAGGYEGNASRSTDQDLERILEATLNYSGLFNEVHRVELLGGYSYEDFVYEGFSAGNRFFITDQYTYNNLGAGDYLLDGKTTMGSYKSESKLIAFFGRAILIIYLPI